MQKKDYYGILGVARDAGESVIRMAYRRLALQNHPDTNREDPKAEDRFKEINEAYEVLSHRGKRNLYDRGCDPLAGDFPFRPSPFDSWSDPFEESFFSRFRCRGGGFGRGFGRQRRAYRETGARPPGSVPYRSELLIHNLPLTPNEALEGAQRDIRLHTGGDTLVFTVSIPAGVENGTLLSFKRALEDGQEMELQFRVRITEGFHSLHNNGYRPGPP